MHIYNNSFFNCKYENKDQSFGVTLILDKIKYHQFEATCRDSCKVTRSTNAIGVQLQTIQYVFQIKILSIDTSSFQRRDCWKMKETMRLKYDVQYSLQLANTVRAKKTVR